MFSRRSSEGGGKATKQSPHPAVRSRAFQLNEQQEAFCMDERVELPGVDPIHAFGLFVGHNGGAAAQFVSQNFWQRVLGKLQRLSLPPAEGEKSLVGRVEEAAVRAFRWCHDNIPEGDSRAVLDTAAGGVMDLTTDHRFDTSSDERTKVLEKVQAGQCFRLASGAVWEPSGGFRAKAQQSVLFWGRGMPVGLPVSRIIGCHGCSPAVSYGPQTKLIRLHAPGGRIVIGSRSLWEVASAPAAAQLIRGKPLDSAAQMLVEGSTRARQGKRNEGRKDVTAIVLDIGTPSPSIHKPSRGDPKPQARPVRSPAGAVPASPSSSNKTPSSIAKSRNGTAKSRSSTAKSASSSAKSAGSTAKSASSSATSSHSSKTVPSDGAGAAACSTSALPAVPSPRDRLAEEFQHPSMLSNEGSNTSGGRAPNRWGIVPVADTAMQSVDPTRVRTIVDLPEALAVEILTRVSEKTQGLDFALVCCQWNRLCSQSVVAMRVRRRQRREEHTGAQRQEFLAEARLLVPIFSFRSLRVLRIERRSVLELSSALLDALASCYQLREVHVEQGATRMGCSFPRESLSALFAALPQLEMLLLKDESTERWQIPDSISRLQRLQALHLGTLRRSTDCAELPCTLSAISSLTSLTAHFQSVPPWLTRMTQLQVLHLLSYQQDSLPPSLRSLVGLTSLSLSGSFSLQSISPEAFHLPKLRHLSVEGAPHLWELPPSLGLWANDLRTLAITGCISLVHLPPSLGKLTRLTRLILDRCSALLELPASARDLSSLQELDLSFCRGLLQLPPDLGKVTSLRRLRLHVLDALHALPPSVGNLRQLQQLSVSSCHALEELPPNLGNLSSLQVLSICDCPRLTCLPSRLGHLQQLQVLRVKATGVSSLPESVSSLVALGEIDVSAHLVLGAPQLELLPGLSERCRARLRAAREGIAIDAMDTDNETGQYTTSSASSPLEVEMDDYETERDEEMWDQELQDTPPAHDMGGEVPKDSPQWGSPATWQNQRTQAPHWRSPRDSLDHVTEHGASTSPASASTSVGSGRGSRVQESSARRFPWQR